MIEEIGLKFDDLLEVSDVELSLHVQLDHVFDGGERRGNLSNQEHVQGLIKVVLEI